MSLWAEVCDCLGYKAPRIEFRLCPSCRRNSATSACTWPSVWGDEKKLFSWCCFPGDVCLRTSASCSYCWVCALFSCVCQHVHAHIRWNTDNTVIGEIRLAFWERQARSCYFAWPPSPSILTLFTTLSVSSSSIIPPSVKREMCIISFYVPDSAWSAHEG